MGEFKLQKNFNQSCSSKNFSGSLVEMAFWLVHASYMLANENFDLDLED